MFKIQLKFKIKDKLTRAIRQARQQEEELRKQKVFFRNHNFKLEDEYVSIKNEI